MTDIHWFVVLMLQQIELHHLKSRKQGCKTLINQHLKIFYFSSRQSFLANTALAEA